jgi:predicted site-specific integrase-resolvase
VSSQAQRPELKNQRRIVEEFAIAKGIANLEFIEEIGGGLNCTRPKFTALVDSVVVDELARLVVAHQDRLARFGFPAVSQAASRHQWT